MVCGNTFQTKLLPSSTLKRYSEDMCILYNQGDATYTMFFIIISALHISGGG